MLEQRIQQHFIDSADLKYQCAQSLSKPIAAAVQAVLACVTSGGKVLACGNGGSAADAFLGTQGDVWDTQWDMFLALIGAVITLAIFGKWHERQLRKTY